MTHNRQGTHPRRQVPVNSASLPVPPEAELHGPMAHTSPLLAVCGIVPSSSASLRSAESAVNPWLQPVSRQLTHFWKETAPTNLADYFPQPDKIEIEIHLRVPHSSPVFVKFHDMLSKMFRDILSNSAAVGREGKWETRSVFQGGGSAVFSSLRGSDRDPSRDDGGATDRRFQLPDQSVAVIDLEALVDFKDLDHSPARARRQPYNVAVPATEEAVITSP